MIYSKFELKRSTGILLHPTSLPDSSICGSFGEPARNWIKMLAKNRIAVWQFLPLSPTDSTGSPYSSPSGFAYNPWFLDVNDLVKEGFLTEALVSDLPGFKIIDNSFVDFELANLKTKQITKYLIQEWSKKSGEVHSEFEAWARKQFWLQDHATFMELRAQNKNLPWWEWPKDFSNYDKYAINCWRKINKNNLLGHSLLQWHLDRQWTALRQLAKDVGVYLFGDLPFYVSRDSADVWSNQSLFSIFLNGSIYLQSGVPPDYFSDTGQLWGNPVYRWSRHKVTRFKWWRKRFARHLQQVDFLRLDHFRALEAFWAVPGNELTAVNGYWRSSPGIELLSLVEKDCKGTLPLVAEDLGLITSGVERLRDYFNLPGMKILQFAFDGDRSNPYLPENIHGENWIVYTGTHDNSTTLGWWNEINDNKKEEIKQNFSDKNNLASWELIKIGMKTDAKIFVAPLQDILELDNSARLNKPGTINDNWSWRFSNENSFLEEKIIQYGKLGEYFQR